MGATCFIFSRLNARELSLPLRKNKAKFVQSTAEPGRSAEVPLGRRGKSMDFVTTSKRFESEPAGIVKKAQSPRVCWTRRRLYRFHYFMATGIHSSAVAEGFMEHAREEQAHADQLAERIKQLGGKPELQPSVIAERSHSEYREGTSLADMIREFDRRAYCHRDLWGNGAVLRRQGYDLPSHAGRDLGEGRRACGRIGGPAVCCATGHNQGSRRSYSSDETPEREPVRS